MKIDLSGEWKITLGGEDIPKEWEGNIMLPGILQAQGYGNLVTLDTPWVSGLHDPLWQLRKDYQYEQEESCQVPFLSQPPRHYLGKAWYQREIQVPQSGKWILHMELTRWETNVWIDGKYQGSDCSLCTAHEISLDYVDKGCHVLIICVDNSMKFPYRPDGHGVSDALGASWNGIAGEFMLLSEEELEKRTKRRRQYSIDFPRTAEIREDMFYIDGKAEYFRGTHFGGDYPLTGYPENDKAWWDRIMNIVKKWGLNFIRCHSCCPPEAAFLAADEAGVYLQPECGMWNVFNEEIEMLDVLRQETKRILTQFGHHPSFVLFSPTNEPDGSWYQPLRRWVSETREFDRLLGYEGRRIYTAQSGWFYDVPPKEIEGTDYIYFHRSAYGPILGGNIRNYEGWKGKDYRPSLEGASRPVICHEMGQWCSYPDFSVIDQFTGYLLPGNYKVFRANAIDRGVFDQNKDFVYSSGRTQVRMYKEDLEANFRTPHMYGFELLDLHDYLGQGTALVGVLDAFWREKGYVNAEEWRQFCNETVILARISSYVYKNTETAVIPVEICHFGREILEPASLHWRLKDGAQCLLEGQWETGPVARGKNQMLGNIVLDFTGIKVNRILVLEVLRDGIRNTWELFVYGKDTFEETDEPKEQVVFSSDWEETKDALARGGRVVFCPYLSSLDYDCPPLAMRPVFWNAQMGPNWLRPLGMIAKSTHPLFRNFPTGADGGWHWEEILSRARAFDAQGLLAGEDMIVQPIDEWNRNLLQSLIFECRVGSGRLLMITADLEGSFEERPAAWSLKRAALSYAASLEFEPMKELEPGKLESHFSSNNIMNALGVRVEVPADVKAEGAEQLLDGNPNTSALFRKEQYPISIELCFSEPVRMKGLIYMAGQKDRMHEGDIKEYCVWTRQQDVWEVAAKGCLESTERQQKIWFDRELDSSRLRFCALSGYQLAEKVVWEGKRDGWHQVEKKMEAKAEIAVLNIISDAKIPGNNQIYWDKTIRSTTKEIDD